jgi:hypothetical protein
MTTDAVLPTDRACLQRAAGQKRAHLDEHLARCLYRRLRRRTIVLTRPVPLGVRQSLADWVHRDGLVLACATYVSGNGRRVQCHAQVFSMCDWWLFGHGQWARTAVPSMRLVNVQTFLPSALGPRQAWPDVSF